MEPIRVDSKKDVNVPEELRNTIVQCDHNILDITVEIPKTWHEDKDISGCVFYANHINIKKNKKAKRTPLTNIHVSEEGPDTLIMTWTITKELSKYEGDFSFLFCAIKTDENGQEELHWNSNLCEQMSVKEGLEADDDEYIEQNPDVITAILLELGRLPQKKAELIGTVEVTEECQDLDFGTCKSDYTRLLILLSGVTKTAGSYKVYVDGTNYVVSNSTSASEYAIEIELYADSLLRASMGKNDSASTGYVCWRDDVMHNGIISKGSEIILSSNAVLTAGKASAYGIR